MITWLCAVFSFGHEPTFLKTSLPAPTDSNLHFPKSALPPPMGEVAEHSEAGEGIDPLSRLRRQLSHRESQVIAFGDAIFFENCRGGEPVGDGFPVPFSTGPVPNYTKNYPSHRGTKPYARGCFADVYSASESENR